MIHPERRISILSRKATLIFCLTLLVIAFAGCSANDEDQTNDGDQEGQVENVASVNGVGIEKMYFDIQYEQIEMAYAMQGLDVEAKETQEMLQMEKDQLINNMITHELLVQEAEKEGYEASADEIDEQLELLMVNFPEEGQFEEVLEANELSLEEVKEMLSKDIIINHYIENNMGEISVSQEEIDKLVATYEEGREAAENEENNEGQEQEEIDPQELRRQAEELLSEQEKQQRINEIVQGLRDKSDIEIYL